MKVIFRMLNHPCDNSLSNEIKKILRPKNNGGLDIVKHN